MPIQWRREMRRRGRAAPHLGQTASCGDRRAATGQARACRFHRANSQRNDHSGDGVSGVPSQHLTFREPDAGRSDSAPAGEQQSAREADRRVVTSCYCSDIECQLRIVSADLAVGKAPGAVIQRPAFVRALLVHVLSGMRRTGKEAHLLSIIMTAWDARSTSRARESSSGCATPAVRRQIRVAGLLRSVARESATMIGML